jgi:hypothetical protein
MIEAAELARQSQVATQATYLLQIEAPQILKLVDVLSISCFAVGGMWNLLNCETLVFMC